MVVRKEKFSSIVAVYDVCSQVGWLRFLLMLTTTLAVEDKPPESVARTRI